MSKKLSMDIIIVGLFGVVNIVGGLVGYLKAGSVASLISGGISGVILLLCAYGISLGSRFAAIVSIIIAILLGGRFITTIAKKFKIVPDLVIIIFSLLTIIVVGVSFF